MCIKKNKKWTSKFKAPQAITILFFITAIVILMSWIPGFTLNSSKNFKDITDLLIKMSPSKDKSLIPSGRPAGILDLFLAPLKGFGTKLDTILFILILGGFLEQIIKSKSLDASIGRLILKLKNKKMWILPIIVIFFSIGGSTYGMGEETIALYPVLIPVMLSAGFDVLTSFMTILLGAGIGCIGSFLNPFVIQVSFNITDTEIYGITSSAGIFWRVICWIILTLFTILFLIWYAKYIKKNPKKSPLYNQKEFYYNHFKFVDVSGNEDNSTEQYELKKIKNKNNKESKILLDASTSEIIVENSENEKEGLPAFTNKRKAILIIFSLTFLFMIFSLISWSSFGIKSFSNFNDLLQKKFPYFVSFFEPFGDFDLICVSAMFLLSSIIIGFISKEGEEVFIKSFFKGTSSIVDVCLVIGTASGIGWIMKETGMQHVLIYNIKQPMLNLGKTGFIVVSFIFFILISIVIPSTSGFAAAVMPILGPVSEQVHSGLWSGTITAFSFANGFVNLISPTSVILMSALSISKISITKYFKVIWPFLLILFIILIFLLTLGTFIFPIKQNGVWF